MAGMRRQQGSRERRLRDVTHSISGGETHRTPSGDLLAAARVETPRGSLNAFPARRRIRLAADYPVSRDDEGTCGVARLSLETGFLLAVSDDARRRSITAVAHRIVQYGTEETEDV
jgi:hypothetical protein